MSGVCGATTCCIPATQCPAGSDCGVMPDGCGGFVTCGSLTCSVGGDTCGGGGVNYKCGTGAPPCTKKTTCTPAGADCGQQSDDCGGVIDCCATPPCTCATGTCGGGGSPNTCGVACTPLTCAGVGANCGLIGDGCGGTLDCGTCAAPKTCGGGGVASQCGCKGLLCQEVACPGSGTTTVTGVVYAGTTPAYWDTTSTSKTVGGATVNCSTAPLGTAGCGPDPLFNALVYIPNAALEPFTPGVTCSQCSANVSGDPIMWANTTTTGSFTLTNVPVGSNIPLVIQFGYWRRQITIPKVTQCTANVLPGPSDCATNADQTSCQNANCFWNTAVTPSCETLTRLPRKQTEGDMPFIALSTGSADAVECVLPKIGIDPSEMTPPGYGGRVNFFRDNGARLANWTCGGGGVSGMCGTDSCVPKTRATACAGKTCGTVSDGCASYFTCGTCTSPRTCGGGGVPGTCGSGTTCVPKTCAQLGVTCGYADNGCGTRIRCGNNGDCTPPASDLYNNLATLKNYNIVIWDCVGSHSNKSATAKQNVMDYVNAGGRMFGTHYGYVWLYDQAPFGCTTPVGCNNGTDCTVCTTPTQTTAFWAPQRASPSNSTVLPACLVADPAKNPEGASFTAWLENVGSIGSGMTPSCAAGEKYMPVQYVRQDALMPAVVGGGVTWPGTSQLWAYTNAWDGPMNWNTPIEFTFNTPVGAAPANQCGRVLYSDFHVYNSYGGDFPTPDCTVGPLTPQEKILEYMIFDLSNCVSTTPDCLPKTCPEGSCGPMADGCGGLANGGSCGECTSPEVCGAGGPNLCGLPTGCTPSGSCAGRTCGYVSDGCGDVIECGSITCPGSQVCNNGTCSTSCPPLTACPAGYNCGTIPNNCGGTVSCGTCTAPQTCGGSGTPNVCGSACTPTTCAAAGANCGQIGDGCGGVLNCGTCISPAVCGAGGVANVCASPCSTSTCSVDSDCCAPFFCAVGMCMSN